LLCLAFGTARPASSEAGHKNVLCLPASLASHPSEATLRVASLACKAWAALLR